MSFDDDSAFPFKKGQGGSADNQDNVNNKPGFDDNGKPAQRFTFRQAAEAKDNNYAPDKKAEVETEPTKAEPAKAEPTKTESTKTETPKAEAPKVESKAEKPETEKPKTVTPENVAPKAKPKMTPEEREKLMKKKRASRSEFYESSPIPEVPEKKGKKGLIALVAVVTTLAIAYVVMSVLFRSRIMFRTSIDGIDCSFKSIDEIEELVTERVDGYELNIRTIEGIFYKIKSSDIDLKCDIKSELKSLCERQPIFTWPASLFKDTDLSVGLKLDYDESKLQQRLDSFGFLNPSNMTAPVEAKLVDYVPSRGFVVQDSVFGNTINENVFVTQLKKAITSLNGDLDLKAGNCYVQPLYTEDSDDFKLLEAQAEKCVGSKITYTFGGMNETLTIKDFLPWLTLNDSKELTIDDNSILDYVKGIAGKYTSTNDSRAFKTTYGEVVNIPARTYGFQVDVNKEAEKLKEDIFSGQEVSRAPVFVDSDGNGVKDFGNSYVEINLGMQHLFLYVDGVKVFECDIVSGLPSAGSATPVGIYAIYYCARDRVLRGPGYASPVAYWMPFNGGIGIHDATWQPRFGYDRYLRNGSHGCINVSLDSAATIYSYVSAGFPVICYQYGTAAPEPGVVQGQTDQQGVEQQQEQQDEQRPLVERFDPETNTYYYE
ncbi:MAG: peptidoglycan binding domain-containing protein [Lachnospiraceae bacterium]|nr:peptidoglycan binding domain-containing protein [Lachnospiraceae bacterium]